MKPIWKILIAVAVVTALALVIFSNNGRKAALDAYLAQLKQRGEKINVEELAPRVSPDAEKAGRELLAAADGLGYLKCNPHSMVILAPGHAMVGWAETILPTYDSTNAWPEITEAVKKNPEALTAVRQALDQPAIGFPMHYQQGFPSVTTNLMLTKKVSLNFHAATAVALRERDEASAWSNVLAGSQLIRKSDFDPSMITLLVRSAMLSFQVAQTWDALQYPGWSEPQLAELQQKWESFEAFGVAENALSMERVMGSLEFNKLRGSYSNLANSFLVGPAVLGTNAADYEDFRGMMSHPVEGIKAHMRYHAWKTSDSYDEELCVWQIYQAALEAVRHARNSDACVPAFNDFKTAATNILNSFPGWGQRFAFAGDLADEISPFLLRTAEGEAGRRMLVTAIALERYRLRHGKYPGQLADLTPDLLSKVPLDFMDGKQLRYRLRDEGTFLLYSVGEDGKDDGGDGSPPQGSTMANKPWYRMRDAVWPVPATAQELKNYEEEMLKEVEPKKPGSAPMPVLAPAGTNSQTN